MVVARREPPASIHGKTLASPAAEKMEFPETVRLVVVASVVEELTILRLVIVEVPEFTRMPPVNESWVEVALFGKGQEKPSVLKSVPQEKTPADQVSLPVVVSQASSPSLNSFEVEATPEIVIAVEEAYGKMEAVVEVAVK